jgi:predicted cation transporter
VDKRAFRGRGLIRSYLSQNLEDYNFGMEQVMNDRAFVYKTLIKDVYSQGVVLGRKYKLLRIAYNIFTYGLIASVIAFVGASIIAEEMITHLNKQECEP